MCSISLSDLSPFQRALLAIDGTVTQFIEAYMMEKVEVVHLNQKIEALDSDCLWLNAPAETDVLYRQVLLRGGSSSTLYAHAISRIILERLPKDVRKGLAQQGSGLGRLVLGNRMESRRDMLWYGIEKPSDLPSEAQDAAGQAFLCRSYRIIAGRQPLMWIHERFPLSTTGVAHDREKR